MHAYHSTARTTGQTRPRIRPGARTQRRAKRRAPDPFWELIETARRLQAPGGCSWDRAQTLHSLFPYLLEEAWEVFEVIGRRTARSSGARRPLQRRRSGRGGGGADGWDVRLQEELGDVLYTVLFLALIAERDGRCDLRALLTSTRRKMVRRHPHVFGNVAADTPDDAYQAWNAVKRRERRSVSRGKALRPLLMDCWDTLRREPQAARRLQRLLARLRKTSGSPTPSSARPGRATARS